MWALTLFTAALATHAVLVAWLRRAFHLGRLATLALAACALFLSLALFLPREDFGYTSFELAVVSFGAGGFVALLSAGWLFARARTIVAKFSPRTRHASAAGDAVKIAPTSAREPRADAVDGAKGPRDPTKLTTRREAFVRIAGGVSWAASAGSLSWGALRGRHEYELVEFAVKIPGLPRALDGYTMVQISDIHVGEFVGEDDLARGLSLVESARPDLLLVTGDLVDFDESLATMAASRIARIKPRDGIVGILGNHDYYADAGVVRAALASAGIDVLVNESRVIRKADGGGFALVGLDDYYGVKYGARGPDLAGSLALAQKDVPRILLAHQPRMFDAAAGKVALQISGHTHGLQFELAGGAARLMHKYVAGRYDKDGSVLYVNRGFGVTGPPSRVGVSPEVTKIVLAAG